MDSDRRREIISTAAKLLPAMADSDCCRESYIYCAHRSCVNELCEHTVSANDVVCIVKTVYATAALWMLVLKDSPLVLTITLYCYVHDTIIGRRSPVLYGS